MIVLGIDPGLHGAWAALDTVINDLVVRDFPLLKVGMMSRADLDLAGLVAEWRDIVAAIDHVMIEQVSARPRQGVTSMFRFGRAAGQVHGVLVALGVPVTFVTPQTWQKRVGVGPGPDDARARAGSLFPALAGQFSRKVDQHRADAALLAVYGGQVLDRGTRAAA